MEVAFSGINIYSKKPEAVFEFYKKLGFRVLEEVAPDDKWYGSTLALQDGDNAPIIWIWRQSDEDNSVVCNHFVLSELIAFTIRLYSHRLETKPAFSILRARYPSWMVGSKSSSCRL